MAVWLLCFVPCHLYECLGNWLGGWVDGGKKVVLAVSQIL